MRKMLQYRLADLDSMLVLLFAFLQPISAQKADDNVHILQCNDRYVFKTDETRQTYLADFGMLPTPRDEEHYIPKMEN